MPQASEDLREIMRRMFPNKISSITDIPVVEQYLKNKNWTITSGGIQIAPYENIIDIPLDEWHCALYLCEEWDYDLELQHEMVQPVTVADNMVYERAGYAMWTLMLFLLAAYLAINYGFNTWWIAVLTLIGTAFLYHALMWGASVIKLYGGKNELR